MIVSDLLKYEKLGNGVIIKYDGRLVFAIGKKDYWKKTNDTWIITFTNTGGHVEIGETIIEATHRELNEELGCKVELQSSNQTLYCELEAPKFECYVLEDEITPILIYNSYKLQMTICVYLGHLSSPPTPMMEVPALLHILPHLVQGGKLQDLLNSGCLIQEQGKYYIPRSAIMMPFGSAKLIAEHWKVFTQLSCFQNYIF